MKNRIITTLLISLFAASNVSADMAFSEISDFTGDSFFTSATNVQNESSTSNGHKSNSSVPPIKKLRLSIQEHAKKRINDKLQLAPTDPNLTIYDKKDETSDYVSKEIVEDFDDDIMPDGFEADEESINEVKNKKSLKLFGHKNKQNPVGNSDNTEGIILDCENMDYDTDSYCLYATGNVNVEFVKQNTIVKADKITYDRAANTIKAEGNVKILKDGQLITGDYIFVDMNEENALIETPIANMNSVEIRSQKGYVYGDKIVQENGSITVDEPFPVNFSSAQNIKIMQNMILPKDQTLTSDIEKGLLKIKVKNIKITQDGDMEILALKRANVKKGKHTILRIPSIKMYTNKNHDYVETNSWEFGTLRGLGMYVGPGFVFKLPKASVFKVIPMLNVKSGAGFGGVGRFSSANNVTQLAYGTASKTLLVRGQQKLDDNLYLQYSMNDYMNEWFLGRRRPKYGAALVYQKTYAADSFLIKNRVSSYSHRLDFGYYQDIDHDRHYRALNGANLGTTRTRYMAEASQNLFDYRNEDKQTAMSLNLVGNLSTALYGTGETQVIGRVGPMLHTQWRRWMQDLGYYQSVYDDHTPMPVYDAYRYGKSNFYIREYLRLSKYLTLCWFGSINLSGDSPNNRSMQENSFFASIGPDDFKFNIGYDTIRENTFFAFEVLMDAKGSKIDFDKMEIKQYKKAKNNENKQKEPETVNTFQSPQKAPVLQRAVVEEIKTVEDVL